MARKVSNGKGLNVFWWSKYHFAKLEFSEVTMKFVTYPHYWDHPAADKGVGVYGSRQDRGHSVPQPPKIQKGVFQIPTLKITRKIKRPYHSSSSKAGINENNSICWRIKKF